VSNHITFLKINHRDFAAGSMKIGYLPPQKTSIFPTFVLLAQLPPDEAVPGFVPARGKLPG
jgi:hypothetical protein